MASVSLHLSRCHSQTLGNTWCIETLAAGHTCKARYAKQLTLFCLRSSYGFISSINENLCDMSLTGRNPLRQHSQPWIINSKINLQLERHFLLSAAEAVSPFRPFSWSWCCLMRVWSGGWQLSSLKAFVKILLQGRFEQPVAHRNSSTRHIALISPQLGLPGGYMCCMWRASFSMTLINNSEQIQIKLYISIHTKQQKATMRQYIQTCFRFDIYYQDRLEDNIYAHFFCKGWLGKTHSYDPLSMCLKRTMMIKSGS